MAEVVGSRVERRRKFARERRAQAFRAEAGLVVVGWLGRDSTTLHCTHHVSTRRLKRHQSDFSFCLCLQCIS